jgi:hypothetical protein
MDIPLKKLEYAVICGVHTAFFSKRLKNSFICVHNTVGCLLKGTHVHVIIHSLGAHRPSTGGVVLISHTTLSHGHGCAYAN